METINADVTEWRFIASLLYRHTAWHPTHHRAVKDRRARGKNCRDTIGSGQEYWEKHKAILEPASPTMGSGQEEVDKATLQDSYDLHLQQLGLLTPRYNVDHKTKQVHVGHDGDLEVRGYTLSSFGRLLLRQLNIIVPEEHR